MDDAPPRRRRWLAFILIAIGLTLAAATVAFRDDLMRTALDPKKPFQISPPPPAPDFSSRKGWALLPMRPDAPTAAEPEVDVFFVGPTTYAGGDRWNAPVDESAANRAFAEVMAPNYAGPFVRVGRIFSPRYRQASLYSLLTLREDARDARRFAYGDVVNAFRLWRAQYGAARPFILVGVEQGGTMAARLLADEIAPDATLRGRLVAAYLIDTVIPAAPTSVPACAMPGEAGCLAAWSPVFEGDQDRADTLLDRALVWNPAGELENLGERPALCFNPILGAVTDRPAPARLHRGAANATGLEWGARPAFMARQVSARCVGGVLRISAPRSAAFKRTGSWANRRMEPGYNLFYADIEADAQGRVKGSAAIPRP